MGSEVKSVGAGFCIDLVKGDDDARRRVDEISKSGERVAISAFALAEFLAGAFDQGGKRLA